MADPTEVDRILELLESRVKRIEEKVYCKLEKLEDGKIAELIFEAQRQLKDAEAKSAAAGTVFKHLKSLDKYLSIEFLERSSSNSNAAADIILSGEDKLKEVALLLEDVDKNKEILDENHLFDVPQWSAKLEPLVQVQIQQLDGASHLNERAEQLLSAYNEIISSLSKQFIQWDNVITQCEIAVCKDKSNDD